MEARAIAIQDGERVRHERHRRRLSQRALAARIGVRAASISELERGEAVSPDLLFRVALMLAVMEPV